MSGLFPARGQWTVDLLSQLPVDQHIYEIIDGCLNVVFQNEDSHSFAVWSMATLIASFAWAHECDLIVGPKAYHFNVISVLQPDLVVRPQTALYQSLGLVGASTLPLVVEIATPYSRGFDSAVKREFYQRNGVLTYWQVDYAEREVLVWEKGKSTPEIVTGELRWRPHSSKRELTIDLPAYFHAVPEFDFSHDRVSRWLVYRGRERVERD